MGKRGSNIAIDGKTCYKYVDTVGSCCLSELVLRITVCDMFREIIVNVTDVHFGVIGTRQKSMSYIGLDAYCAESHFCRITLQDEPSLGT